MSQPNEVTSNGPTQHAVINQDFHEGVRLQVDLDSITLHFAQEFNKSRQSKVQKPLNNCNYTLTLSVNMFLI